MEQILLIDSEESIIQEVSDYLKNLGYNILIAYDGPSGVQKALQYTPDVIICDTDLEGLSGHEVFNMIQQINTTAVIPFIFMTTKKSYEDLRAVMNLGVDDFIVKPFEYAELKRLLEVRIQKQEKILNQIDERFNLLIDHAYAAIYIYQDERLEYVNQKFCQILGYSKKELLGMSLVNIIYKDDIHIVIDKINRCFRGIHDELEVGFRAIRRDRKIIYVKLSGSIVSMKGKKSLVGTLAKQEEPESSDSEAKQDFENNRKPEANNLEVTSRERDVLKFICEGLSNQEIGEKLSISVRTVEGHRNRLLKKTGCKNSVELAVFAVKFGYFKI
jgi:PAS domain S-box-containing protein